MCNTTALPCDHLTDSAIFSSKRLIPKPNIDRVELINRLLKILRSTINESDLEYFDVHELTPEEIWEDIKYYINNKGSIYNELSIQYILQERGINCENQPDYYVTPRMKTNIEGILNTAFL